MSSSKLQMLIWTVLVIFSTRASSSLTAFATFTVPPSLARQSRAASSAGVEGLLPQPEICKEFVESKVVPKGAKASSVADIFYNLSIGKDFATAGRKHAKSYVFQSPNYPREYPESIECYKLIVAPSQDHRIYLRISQPFDLEPESLCGMDFLEVRDGAFGFSPLIGRFCSRLPPPENELIRSTSRYLWLRFRSDSTLSRTGFRAVFHFQKIDNEPDEYEESHPKILRRLNVIQLGEDEQWTMRSDFLTKQLEYISVEERQMPMEAVFDIRSPPGTHILMYVHHFQVPQVTAWSCDPEFLAKQKAIKYCDYHSGPILMKIDSFTEKLPNIIQGLLSVENTEDILCSVKQYTSAVPDPVSYMDGTHTYVEIYTDGQTIPESSPPCPRVDRFCIATAHTDLSDNVSLGSASSSEKDDGRPRRQFLVQSPRLVIRLVVAKPFRPPHDSTMDDGQDSVLENGIDPYETVETLDVFTMLPNFTFTLTTLSPRVDNACAPNQRACDDAYCIQNGHWCDGIVNCPLGQDEEDAACNPEKAAAVENVDETDATEMSEKDQAALEREIEEKADLEKHAAIIGSISLTLIIITIICMFFAIRRKRKEANHHVIEIKLPSDVDDTPLNASNAKNGDKDASVTPLQPSKLLNSDVIIDMDELENEPIFSSSGDALLGSGQKGIFSNHNWEKKASPAIARTFGLNSHPKSPYTKTGKSRNALFQHQQVQQQQQKSQRNTWQSDANLIQHSQMHQNRGELNRGDSTKTADEVTNLRHIQPQLPPRMNNSPLPIQTPTSKNRLSRNPRQQFAKKSQEEHRNRGRHHRHHHRHQHRRSRHQKSEKEQGHPGQQPKLLLRQKTSNTDVPDQETHVLNCRLLMEQQRTRSLAASKFHLCDSREFVDPYGGEFSSSRDGTRSSSISSTSSSGLTASTSSTKSSSTTTCSSNSNTSISNCPQKRTQRGYRGYENLAPYSIRLKAFRSMPDVARVTGPSSIPHGSGRVSGGGQLAVSCGHKDCRDYYRLQALRSDFQMERRWPEKVSLDKPVLLRETEIELTPSSEEGEGLVRTGEGGGVGGNPEDKTLPLPNPIASDAYSVHGLSDAVSIESSKDGSEATHSAFTEESNGSGRNSSYTSTNSPLSPRQPTRVSSINQSLSRVTSLSRHLDSPASSRSRARVHPTTSKLLVYEYEA